MNMIVYCNRTITPGGSWVGHVGWGFLQGNMWMYGSKESGPELFSWHIGVIGNHQPNGVRIAVRTYAHMIDCLKSGGVNPGPLFQYHQYKLLTCPHPNLKQAIAHMQMLSDRGYGLFGNNCMDDVYQVLTAYCGDANFLPWPSTHWTPCSFFDGIGVAPVTMNHWKP